MKCFRQAIELLVRVPSYSQDLEREGEDAKRQVFAQLRDTAALLFDMDGVLADVTHSQHKVRCAHMRLHLMRPVHHRDRETVWRRSDGGRHHARQSSGKREQRLGGACRRPRMNELTSAQITKNLVHELSAHAPTLEEVTAKYEAIYQVH